MHHLPPSRSQLSRYRANKSSNSVRQELAHLYPLGHMFSIGEEPVKFVFVLNLLLERNQFHCLDMMSGKLLCLPLTFVQVVWVFDVCTGYKRYLECSAMCEICYVICIQKSTAL